MKPKSKNYIIILSLSILIACILTIAINIHPFLAITKPVNGEVLVVEGWIPKPALHKAKEIFEEGNYRLIATVGISSKDHNIANDSEKAAAYFINNGIDKKKILITVAEYTTTNKTKSFALELKRHIQFQNKDIHRIDILTFGAHARKSYVVFKKVFEPEVKVGIISIRPHTYHPRLWWLSVEGWQWVVKDTIKYLVALSDFS